MKWRVDIEYEDGSFTEPRRIAFQAVYDGEPYHGYETKREALEAFCVGQVAIDELRKEREAEQKKEEPKPIDYSRYCKTAIFDPSKPTIEERLDLLERYLGISKHKMKQTIATLFVKQDNRLEKIEQRLTEIEGVLSSIGSPDYDLRKKVEAIETQTGKKNIEEINEVLEMIDKGKADTFYEQVNKIGKNDYKECKSNPFRCEKCGLEFKVVSQERALVEHCPSCGDKPKRIEE